MLEKYKHADFIENKYYIWYFTIISAASTRAKTTRYYEKHHIIPKSMGHCKDVVHLTAKEHYICHHLLTKFTSGESKYSMFYAYNSMVFLENSLQERYKTTSNQYAYAKILNAEATSRRFKGRVFSATYKQRIREGLSIGTFKTPWGDYVSATQAGIECPTGKVSPHCILNYCKNRNDKNLHIKSIIQSKYFTTVDEGKTFKVLGFSFIPR